MDISSFPFPMRLTPHVNEKVVGLIDPGGFVPESHACSCLPAQLITTESIVRVASMLPLEQLF